MNQIIEYMGAKGVRTATLVHRRMETPQPGDLVRWADGTFGRIWTIGGTYAVEGHAQVCETQGSAFLGDGYVSISGGPFRHIPVTDLQPTMELRPSWFWNWGDNLPGAGKGCDFALPRPVFNYIGQ